MKKNYILFIIASIVANYSFSQDFKAVSNSLEFTTQSRDANSVIWDQPVGGGSNGIVSDYFTGIPGGTYAAEDFQLTASTKIGTITAYGFQNNMTLETLITGFDVYIYTDNVGEPSSDPSSPGTGVFELINFDPTNPALTITPDGVGGYAFILDVTAANGSEVILGSGIYWLVIAPRMNMADADSDNRWNWYEALGTSNLSEAMLIDPDGVFGGLPWTGLSGLAGFNSLAFTINDEDNLSIGEFEFTKAFISPNPANDIIKIELHPSNNLKSIELYNTIGQVVYRGINETKLNISELSAGVYLLKLDTKKGLLTKRIIKN